MNKDRVKRRLRVNEIRKVHVETYKSILFVVVYIFLFLGSLCSLILRSKMNQDKIQIVSRLDFILNYRELQKFKLNCAYKTKKKQ
jgi:hypothetical protein